MTARASDRMGTTSMPLPFGCAVAASDPVCAFLRPMGDATQNAEDPPFGRRQQTRVREKVMRRFKSARHLQRFASTHDQVANLFMHGRYNRDAAAKRATRSQALRPGVGPAVPGRSAAQPCDVDRRGGVGLLSTSPQQVDSTLTPVSRTLGSPPTHSPRPAGRSARYGRT